MNTERIINYLHYFIVFILISSPFIFNSFILLYIHIIFGIAILLQWYILGYCVLSKESNFDNKKESFTIHLLKDILKIPVPNKYHSLINTTLSYFLIMIPIILSIYKIYINNLFFYPLID
jgi:hypothetical protein